MLETVLDSALRKGISHGNLRLTFPSGRAGIYGDGSGDPIAIRIEDPKSLRAIALDPTLAVAEAYMDGRLVLEHGDIYDLISVAKSNLETRSTTPAAWLQHIRRSVTSAPVARVIGLKTARANVAHHYDLDERLYRLFLDADMQYSCGWFERPDMTLDQAQLAKKRLIASKLLVRPGARVLDIGCGWGGMALYLARCCGADVTGITLSEEQLRVARSRTEAAGLSERIRFRLQDYREVSETFDNIVSVGMFEHVGLRQFPTFFRTAARLLAPEGVMLLHTMTQPEPAPYNQPFIEKYIFPGGYIPAVSEITPSIEKSGLLLRDLEILSLHYAETVKAWRERFLARRDEVLKLYDERFIRMWNFYLAGSENAFRNDGIQVSHFQLADDQERIPLTRAYIAEAQTRLLEREKLVPEYAALHEDSAPDVAALHRDAS